MNILIGTPINENCDYALKAWLESVAKQSYQNIELFLVDTSSSETYLESVKSLLPKNLATTHTHLEASSLSEYEQMAVAREEIRKKVLEGNFDWWFSWEQNLLLPPHALTTLLSFGNEFNIIHHAHPSKDDPDFVADSLGLSLINRNVLKDFTFILDVNKDDPSMPGSYKGVNRWLGRMVYESGGRMVKLYGVIDPIYRSERQK